MNPVSFTTQNLYSTVYYVSPKHDISKLHQVQCLAASCFEILLIAEVWVWQTQERRAESTEQRYAYKVTTVSIGAGNEDRFQNRKWILCRNTDTEDLFQNVFWTLCTMESQQMYWKGWKQIYPLTVRPRTELPLW